MTVWLLPAGEALQADAAASIDNPKKAADGTGIWSCINFGYYYQAGRGSKNPIKWRVLQVNGNDAFLVSDKLLDARQFNDTKVHHSLRNAGKTLQYRAGSMDTAVR